MHTSWHTLTIRWLLAVSVLAPAVGRTETLVVAWPKNFGTGGATGVAVDSRNNVLVTGSYNGFATLKYSPYGTPLWTNYWKDVSNRLATPFRIAVDGSNSVFVAGNVSTGTGLYANDFVTIKYTSEGVPAWTNTFNGNYGAGYHYNGVKGLAVDNSNDVVVTGYSTPDGSRYDYATVKYARDGVPLWTNFFNGPANLDDQPAAVAVDGTNNVFVTGYVDSSNWATIKYSSEGVPESTNYYNGSANGFDRAYAVAIDSDGNAIVTGWSADSAGKGDYVTIKYSGNGTAIWTNVYGGTDDDYALKVATDRDGNVIVSGFSWGGISGDDFATIKYAADGLPLWTNRYSRSSGYSSDQTRALALDSHGNVFITGMTASGYTTIEYSSSGTPLWTNNWSGYNPTGMAVDSNDDVVVTGLSSSSDSFFRTVKYASPWPPLVTARQVTNGECQLQVDRFLINCAVVVEASTNLTAWTPIFTNVRPGPVPAVLYTDTDATNFCARFYRAFQFP